MDIRNALNWFVHEDLKDNIVTLTRSRILAGVGLLLGTIMLLNALRGLRTGDISLTLTIGVCAMVMIAIPFFQRRTGMLTLSSNLFILFYFFILVFASYRGGGIDSQVQYNYVIVIVLSFLICGTRGGLFWSAGTLGMVILFSLMKSGGYEFPAISGANISINLSVLILQMALLAFIYEFSSSSNLGNFAIEKNKSDTTARHLRALFSNVDHVMGRVSEGDLTQRVDTEVDGDLSSLKVSINSALEMLSQTIEEVMVAVREIDSGTGQVSTASQSLASGATEQAASLEEISSSMDEIGSKAKTNSDNAQQAQTLSIQTSEEVERGNRQMDAMLSSMNKIKETSDNVSKVIKVIDEIAFQTNLLALNAAVEAARAGKYGKGFAVVAEEVRNLASRSAEAAKDTTNLISTSLTEVENGVNNADQTAEMLNGFIESVKKVTDIIERIASASQEQAAGAGEINTSLNQVNDVVQQNSSISEETASASEELSSQAEILMNLMNRFRVQQQIR